MKAGLVSLSAITKSGSLRLDPGFYLGRVDIHAIKAARKRARAANRALKARVAEARAERERARTMVTAGEVKTL